MGRSTLIRKESGRGEKSRNHSLWLGWKHGPRAVLAQDSTSVSVTGCPGTPRKSKSHVSHECDMDRPPQRGPAGEWLSFLTLVYK